MHVEPRISAHRSATPRQRRTPLTATLVAIVFTLALAGTAAGHTTANSSTTGATAWSPHPHNEACVKDTKSDGFSVKVEYYLVGSTTIKRTHAESRGVGWESCSVPTIDAVQRFRACRVRPLMPDNCGSWVTVFPA